MDVEIENIMDEIMDLNHQICSFMIDYMHAEKNGIKIEKNKIESNEIFKVLFERLQNAYRRLQDKWMEIPYMDICELESYLEDSYSNLRYIEGYDESGENANSIFEKTDYNILRATEYYLQQENLIRVSTRIDFFNPKDKLSFEEKSSILYDIANKKFDGDQGLKKIDNHIKKLEEEKHKIDEKDYKKKKDNLYELKYILYYRYLNDKYNGILQENDNGRLALVKDEIDHGNILIALNMSEFEIEKIQMLNMKKVRKNFIDMYQSEGNGKNKGKKVKATEEIEMENKENIDKER